MNVRKRLSKGIQDFVHKHDNYKTEQNRTVFYVGRDTVQKKFENLSYLSVECRKKIPGEKIPPFQRGH